MRSLDIEIELEVLNVFRILILDACCVAKDSQLHKEGYNSEPMGKFLVGPILSKQLPDVFLVDEPRCIGHFPTELAHPPNFLREFAFEPLLPAASFQVPLRQAFEQVQAACLRHRENCEKVAQRLFYWALLFQQDRLKVGQLIEVAGKRKEQTLHVRNTAVHQKKLV